MLEALMGTPEGRARLEVYEEKVDRALADRIEAADRPASDKLQPRPPSEPSPVEASREQARPSDFVASSPTPAPSRSPPPREGLELDSEPVPGMEESIDDDSEGADADMGAV